MMNSQMALMIFPSILRPRTPYSFSGKIRLMIGNCFKEYKIELTRYAFFNRKDKKNVEIILLLLQGFDDLSLKLLMIFLTLWNKF